MTWFADPIAPRSFAAMVALIAAALSATILLAAIKTSETTPRKIVGGINFAGAEFNSGRIPGVHGKHYIYPDAKTVAPFRDVGMGAARLPVRWERLQPASPGPLNESEAKRLDAAIKGLSGFRIIIIDLHNYARYRNVRLDQDPQGEAKLIDFWSRLARRYQKNPAIAFGLMNEPHGIGAGDWRLLAEAATRAIRNEGAKNLILVPGTRWTGAHSWTAGGPSSNAAAMKGFRDPGSNFAFEMHQYLDANSSGQSEDCVSPQAAAARLEAATAWLKQHHARGFLAEFGAPANKACLIALQGLLEMVYRHPNAWMGWTYWSAGSWWGTYPMSVQPGKDGRAKPQMAILRDAIGRKR